MLIRTIKKEWGQYVVKRCRGESPRCSIRSSGGAPNVALNCSKLKDDGAFENLNVRHGNINDCVLIEYDGVLHVGVIEFKTGGYSGEHVSKQLLAGSRIVTSLLSRYKIQKKEYSVYLIIVSNRHHSSSRTMFYNKIRRAGGDRSKIIMAGCNDTFKNVRKRLRDF